MGSIVVKSQYASLFLSHPKCRNESSLMCMKGCSFILPCVGIDAVAHQTPWYQFKMLNTSFSARWYLLLCCFASLHRCVVLTCRMFICSAVSAALIMHTVHSPFFFFFLKTTFKLQHLLWVFPSVTLSLTHRHRGCVFYVLPSPPL